MINLENNTYTFYTIVSSSDDYSEEYYEDEKEAEDDLEHYANEWYAGKEIEVFVYSYQFDIDDIIDYFEDELNDIVELNELDNIKEAIEYLEKSEIIESINYINDGLKTHTVNDVNEGVDDLISEVTNELGKIFKKEISKYSYIDFVLKNSDEIISVKLRIADHTHNPSNGRKDVNVVISNEDPTKDRFFNAVEDLRFTTEDDYEDIVSEICTKILYEADIEDTSEIDLEETNIDIELLKGYVI